MIEVEKLVKQYDGHMAVDHLSFTAEKGRIYGFLGPNGAGKTTTMNIMTGCLAPTAGTVRIDGIDVMEEPEQVKRKIGYLPELPPLYPEMTVREYLTFAAKLKKLPRDRIAGEVGNVMERTFLTDRQDKLIRTLSKGYKQRVGLACALLGSPEVIILDEPTVGLDPRQTLEIRDLIRSLREDHTVILSSHILSEVSAVCDYIFIISHGKLAASDTPEGLEQQLHAEGALELTVRATAEEAATLLSASQPALSVDIRPGAEDGTVDLILSEEGKDLRETLFYLFAAAHRPILRMNRRHASLEDIFLELTEDQPAASESQETDAEPTAEREVIEEAAAQAEEALDESEEGKDE